MTPEAKPAPLPDHDSQPFWDGCRAHQLRAQRCTACGRFRWPPRTFCPACWSLDYEWTELLGRGTVYSFSVVHHVVAPAFKQEAPYVVALITVDGSGDQVRLLSNVIDCDWEQVRVGMAVEVVFDETGLPKFRPAAPIQ